MIPSCAMIDGGATGYAFVDETFARCHNLFLYKLRNPRTLEVFDERSIETEDITHIIQIIMKIEEHTEKISMFVTKLSHYSIVLRMP